MDADKLAERDRARRLRQLRNAKLQGIILITCVVLGLAAALMMYFGGEHKPQSWNDEREKPAPALQTAAEEMMPPVVEKSKPPAAEPANPVLPALPAPARQPVAQTIKRTPPGMLKLNGDAGKPAVPVADVLAAIGVAGGEKAQRALPKVEEARRVLELLGKTAHISGKLEYVINKPGIELRMKAYYETRGLKEPEVGEQVADFEIQMMGDRYLDVVYKNPARPSGTIRASFLRDEKGMVRLDWESFTGFSAMDMRVFRDTKPENAVTMRVYASVDDYYNYEFIDAKKFLSVRLRNADGSERVNGYCELGGRVATAINARLATATAADASGGGGGSADNRTWAPIIVKVRFPSKPQSDHCVELMDLMHGQWLAPAGLLE